MTAWTRAAIEALGPVTDVPTTASILLVNKDTIYAQIRRGEWTMTRVLQLGRKIKIPTRDLVACLYGFEPGALAGVGVNPHEAGVCHHEASPQLRAGQSAPQSQSQCDCRDRELASIRALRA
ncbi:hypothetical protein [Streptomyces hokutonensis]|uniref:hypothetical protein n=1 Tax=Streptomyces hokutonensis TaxID=1306990 RepID=UPI0003828936|nr:hypothetical protein [Streptomyces hokutonensis]